MFDSYIEGPSGPPNPLAKQGRCAPQTPCETRGLRPPDTLQYQGAAPPGPPSKMYYDHTTCMYYDHTTCIYYDHSTCMYYDQSTCMYYDHRTSMMSCIYVLPYWSKPNLNWDSL